MRAVLHLGLHKTGSSALQSLLYLNRAALRERGVWYDPAAGSRNHGYLAVASRSPEPWLTQVVQDELLQAARAGCHTCLFSSEMFVEWDTRADLILGALSGAEVEAIAYIRAPDELMVSAYGQLVRDSRWTEPITDVVPYDPTYVDILYQWFATGVPMTLAPYDRSQWPGGSILLDFLAMLGVDGNGLDISVSADDANESLTPALVEILRRINATDIEEPAREQVIKALFDAQRAHPTLYRGPVVSAQERAGYIAAFEATVDALKPRYRPGFDDRFLTASSRPPVRPVSGDGVTPRTFDNEIPRSVWAGIQHGTMHYKYRDLLCLKSPFDLALYLQLLQSLRPRTIIEIGVYEGGSTRWFADTTRALGLECAVIGIDHILTATVTDPAVTLFEGDALQLGNSLTTEYLASLPHPWLVIEDSSHYIETSLAVLEFFDPHLAAGDYIVVEDGIIDSIPIAEYAKFDSGPNRAVEAFLASRTSRYDIDTSLCDQYGRNVTYNPNAWLRRTTRTEVSRDGDE